MSHSGFSAVKDNDIVQLCEHIKFLQGTESSLTWPHGMQDAISNYSDPFSMAIAGKLTLLNNKNVTHWYLPNDYSNINDYYLFAANPSLTQLWLPNCSVMASGLFSSYSGTIQEVSLGLSEVPSYGFNCCKISYLNLPSCTAIRNSAFNAAQIQSWNLPLVSIVESNGFLGFKGSKIDLPKCNHISGAAFAWCGTTLTEVYLPNLETLESGASGLNFFVGCDAASKWTLGFTSSFNSFVFHNFNKALIQELNFPNCKTIRACGTLSNLKSLTIPACESLEYMAFQGCSRLLSVAIPKVSYIGYEAFENCYSLSEITDTDKVQTIDAFAFTNCNSLTTVSFPNCLVMNYDAFANCSNLTSVNFPKLDMIDEECFLNCSQLSTLSFGSSISFIGNGAFMNCAAISSISFEICEEICNYAFSQCTNLSFAYLPGVYTIGEGAFTSVNSSCIFVFNHFISYNEMFGPDITTTASYIIRVPQMVYPSYLTDESWIGRFQGTFESF